MKELGGRLLGLDVANLHPSMRLRAGEFSTNITNLNRLFLWFEYINN